MSVRNGSGNIAQLEGKLCLLFRCQRGKSAVHYEATWGDSHDAAASCIHVGQVRLEFSEITGRMKECEG